MIYSCIPFQVKSRLALAVRSSSSFPSLADLLVPVISLYDVLSPLCCVLHHGRFPLQFNSPAPLLDAGCWAPPAAMATTRPFTDARRLCTFWLCWLALVFHVARAQNSNYSLANSTPYRDMSPYYLRNITLLPCAPDLRSFPEEEIFAFLTGFPFCLFGDGKSPSGYGGRCWNCWNQKKREGGDPRFLYIQTNRGHTRVNHVSFLFSGQTTSRLIAHANGPKMNWKNRKRKNGPV